MRMMKSIGYRKFIFRGYPFGVPDSNVKITFNLTDSNPDSAKKRLNVVHVNFYITFATQMRTQSANINWWHFTTNVVNS
jgi:hypothetical protein